MNSRIRYVRTIKKNTLRSKQSFKSSKGATYKVTLDTKEMTYRIVNLNENRTIKRGGDNINSLRVLKRAAKKALASLGVPFELELRG